MQRSGAKMKINIVVGKVMHGWEPTDKRLGGTEDAAVEWRRRLIERGHEVKVYRNGRGGPQPEGYYERDTYYPDSDITININSSDIPAAGPTIYITNETNANTLDLSSYDAVVWPTQYAEETIPVNNAQRFILPYGYDHTKIFPMEKVINQCLYASSPDRGLDALERIWPRVVEQFPDATLVVTYGGKIDGPNITCGEFTNDEMDELYCKSDLWLHPCNGGELFCITGIKAQAAEAIPVYFPTMALGETVKEGYPCMDETDMFRKICELMNSGYKKGKVRQALRKHHYDSWDDSTDALEQILLSVLEYRQNEHRD